MHNRLQFPLVLAALAAVGLFSPGCSKREGTGSGGCLSGAHGCQVASPCPTLSFPATCGGAMDVRILSGADQLSTVNNALGAHGDALLSNGRVVAVIAGIGNQNYLDPNGGSLLDLYSVGQDNDGLNQLLQITGILPADAVRYRSLELIDERPTRVAVQLKGTLDGYPEVPVYTLYEMRPCEPGIRIRTEIVNTTAYQRLWALSDGFYWSGKELLPFTPEPGAGFAHPSFGLTTINDVYKSYPYVAASSHTAPYSSYALVGCNQNLVEGFNSDIVSASGLPRRVVPPRDFQVYERFLAMASSRDVGGAIDLALEVRQQLYNERYVTLTGKVERPSMPELGHERDASVLISEGRLTTARGERVPWTQVIPDVDGHFTARVPAGRDYVVEVSAFGEKQAESEFPGIDADRDLGTFVLPSTARVTFNVSFSGSGSPVAEVIVVPADEATRTATAGSFYGQSGTCAPWLGPPNGASPACNRVLVPEGTATVDLPVGTYHFYAFKGPFWTIDRKTITLTPILQTIDLAVRQLPLQPAGTVSGDFHVHGRASFDSSLPDEDRVLSFAASDLQVIIATDHEVVQDYGPILRGFGLDGQMSAVAGMETTGHIPYLKIPGYDFPLVIGHYNFWPLKYDPTLPRRGGAFDEFVEPGQLFDSMESRWDTTTAGRVIQLNHPWAEPDFGRDLGFPRAIFLNTLRDLPPDDDGTHQGVYVRARGIAPNNGHHTQEVMNGSQNDLLLPYRTFWFYVLNQGQLVTGTANSDSHSLSDNVVGVPRNMVYTSTTPGSGFDIAEYNDQVRRGRLFGTNGPVIEATLDVPSGGAVGYGLAPFAPKPDGMLHLTVSAAPWVPVQEIRIIVNGQVARTITPTLVQPDDPFGTEGLERFRGDVPLSQLLTGISGDAWIVIEAGRPLMLTGDLGGGLDNAKDGIPDTTDNNGDGVVDTNDVASGRKIGPLRNPPSPASESDLQFHFSSVERNGYPMAFTNPFVLDRNGNGKFDAPGVSGGR